jgi:hypothetical protein
VPIQRSIVEALDALDEVFTVSPRSSEVSRALRTALERRHHRDGANPPEEFVEHVAQLLESDRPLSREDILNLVLSLQGLNLRTLHPYLTEARLRLRMEKIVQKGGFDFVETSTGFHATKMLEDWALEYTLRDHQTRAEEEAVFSVGLSTRRATDWGDLLKRPTVEDLGRRFGVSLKLPEDLGGEWMLTKGGYPLILASLRKATPLGTTVEEVLRRCEGVEIANKAKLQGSDVWFDIVVLKDDPAEPEASLELEVGISSLSRASWDQLKGLTVKGLEAIR